MASAFSTWGVQLLNSRAGFHSEEADADDDEEEEEEEEGRGGIAVATVASVALLENGDLRLARMATTAGEEESLVSSGLAVILPRKHQRGKDMRNWRVAEGRENRNG